MSVHFLPIEADEAQAYRMGLSQLASQAATRAMPRKPRRVKSLLAYLIEFASIVAFFGVVASFFWSF